MKYFSTRSGSERVSAAEAIIRGLAPDGGLYVPESIPCLSPDDFAELCELDYRERAARVMAPFLGEFTPEEVRGLCEAAYGDNFDCAEIAPVRFIDETTAYLELWHGPTSAFKDMALQMLPRLLTASLGKQGVSLGVCILVATSGDTGKAALEGFAGVPGTRIMVFYPRDGVSDVQRLQMVTQEGDNVCVCAVEGNFDDAQSGVKRIFSDAAFAEELRRRGWFLSSANSINWGRLLPQIAYYVSAYCDVVNSGLIIPGESVNFCVPTGNFGNILAGWIAKRMGLPVDRFICASNENNVLTDFINTGVYNRRREFHLTNSPSMDILVSSNLERYTYIYWRPGEDRRLDARARRGWRLRRGRGGPREDTGRLLLRLLHQRGRARRDSPRLGRARLPYRHAYGRGERRALRLPLRDRRRDADPGRLQPRAPISSAPAVLSALGTPAGAPGHELIGRLEGITRTKAPAKLSGLGEKPVRFTSCVAPEDMAAAVDGFIG